MKILKNAITLIIALLLISVGILYATGHGYIVTGFKRTYLAGNLTANINDYTEFSHRTIKTGEKSILSKHENYNSKSLPADFSAELEEFGTAAFLVLKDGQVIHEQYMNGYGDRSKTNSFSMAKTVTTLLLGIAIEEGYVRDLDQNITDFLPEFKTDPLGSKATIAQLSQMNSGYEWVEHYYSPLSPTVELVYGSNVSSFLLEREFSAEPGTFWEYSSASTQLMGIFLKRALQKAGAANNLSEYLSQKIWQPMQMNDDAEWHLDNSDMELVFCCLNTNARNYAKLGLLMMNKGRWNGQQLVPEQFIEKMLKPEGETFYGLSTWLNYEANPNYYWFSGHLGQYIINVPDHNMTIVRLGERTNPNKEFRSVTIPEYIKVGLDLVQ